MKDDDIYVRSFQDLLFGLARSECPETNKETLPCLHLPEEGAHSWVWTLESSVATPPHTHTHKCKDSPVPARPQMSMVRSPRSVSRFPDGEMDGLIRPPPFLMFWLAEASGNPCG